MQLVSRKAQVIIEYVTMAVLVLSAIFLMGPYAIRSINAYFKFSEEAMKDSAGEVFSQESLLPNATPGGCSVGPWEHPTCGISECEVYQRLETRDVDPVGCATDKQCVPDTRCCPDYSMSCGGSGANEVNGVLTGVTESCDFDYRLWKEDCGTYSVTYSCQQDLMCGCVPIKVTSWAWGPFMIDNAVWAGPGDDAHLFRDLNTTYTATFTISNTDNYIVRFSSDNAGDVSIDGSIIVASPGPGFLVSADYNVNLIAGPHTITLHTTNFSTGNSWQANPAGVAMALLDSSNTIVFSTLMLDAWKADVSCPVGKSWDCVGRSCY